MMLLFNYFWERLPLIYNIFDDVCCKNAVDDGCGKVFTIINEQAMNVVVSLYN